MAVIAVAAGVLMDAKGRVYITRRGVHQHQGGLWEFPGGKLEVDETARRALDRELFEEPVSYTHLTLPTNREV